MKSLLIALGLALCCLVQAEDQRFEDTDQSKMSGNWFGRAIVTNCPKMKDMLDRMLAIPMSLQSVSPNEWIMTMDMAMGDGCKKIKPVLTNENGVFSTTCGHGGKKTMGDVNVNKNSMMAETVLSNPKGNCKVVTLWVKDLGDVQSLREGFGAFAARHGLGKEKIHVLPTEGMCERSP